MPNLEEEINAAGGPLPLMRGGRSGVFPFPIKSEFTNWRDEQESWRTTAALMDLSHHMPDLTVQGPGCYRLLSDNWVQFHAATGGYDVTAGRDERTVQNPKGREFFRLQLQGPTAAEIFEKVNGGPMPDIPFFHMGTFNVGKDEVTALNHRMSGFAGLEFFGP
jgi:vanillate/3-O-methylgallate O-demethylase